MTMMMIVRTIMMYSKPFFSYKIFYYNYIMDYIDINGATKFLDLESKNKKIFSVINIDDVDTIIKFSNEIKFLHIENNKNVKTISKFPKSLETLVITNNQFLENIQLPNVKISITIFNNPLLKDIENQIEEYIKTKYYKSVYTKIITVADDDDDDDDIEISYELDKELLNIDDWTFTTNVDEYKKSLPFLHNNNEFLINYRVYNGFEYPIITIPKGTILYNYDRGKNINIKDKYNKLYNLEENYEIEKHLKFFYPLPFAAFIGIEAKYDYCNIVVINNDIQILCLLSPSPISNETLRLQSNNKVINNNFNNINYYDNKFTFNCDTYEHDLCIDLNMMKEMGLQGYISISKEDSISNGDIWRKNITNIELTEFIKEYLFKSCFSSIYQENNNLDFINESLEFNFPNNLKNRLFGVPEIVIVPLNTQFFFDLDIHQNIFDNFNNVTDYDVFNDTDSNINKIFYNYFNYSVIKISNLTELKTYLQSIESYITQNKQSLMFQLFSNKLIDHNISSDMVSIQKTQFYDTDFISSYENKNKKNPYCCFETVAYHLLKNTKFGGKKYKTLKFLKKNKKNKTRYNYNKNRIIKKNNYTQSAGVGNYNNVKLIIETTKKGMLISYFQHNDD